MSRIRHLYLEPAADLERWIDALAAEIKVRAAPELLSTPLRTLLIGGGTPTRYGAEGVQGVRKLLGEALLKGLEEWTVEASPADITPELLECWKEVGVTRPHLSLQSLNGQALEWLGHGHDPDRARGALSLLRIAGFPTWGVDLFFALPREVDPDPIRSLEWVVASGVPHISLYEHVSEEGTEQVDRFGAMTATLPDEEERAEEYLRIATFLLREGYEPYEMTGFSLPGHASLHAVALLEGSAYLGMGPGAESFIDGRLSRNFRDWSDYSARLTEGTSPEEEDAFLDFEEAHLLRIWSRLKLRTGLLRSELSEAGRALADRWREEGVARAEVDRVALTLEGWLRLDGLALEMAQVDASSRGSVRGREEEIGTP